MRLTTALLIPMLVSAAPAQVSPDEAYQKLQERQNQRQASRAEKITISRGDFDDLQSELKRLRAENESLRKQLATATGPTRWNPECPTPKYRAMGALKRANGL